MSNTTGATVDDDAASSVEDTGPSGNAGSGDVTRADTATVDANAESVAPGPPDDGALPLDQVFEILKNQRRRYVLQYLNSADEQVSLSDLAEQIAAWENDKEVRAISSSERKRVYVGLYQCHLPKMDSMGIVDFNKPRGIIERGTNADCFDTYIEPEDDTSEESWNEYYMGATILAMSFLPVVILLQAEAMMPVIVAVSIVAVTVLAAIQQLTNIGLPRRIRA